MDENTLLSQLEELAHSLGIEVRSEPIKKAGSYSAGGLCQLKGEYLVILNSTATKEEQIETLAKAVTRFDLTQVYLRPGLREYLDDFSN